MPINNAYQTYSTDGTLTAPEAQQYLRSCTLIVSTLSGKGLDLSALRIKFSVKRSDTMTPNVADIRVYNLSAETAAQIKKEFTTVLLQGGYQSNQGVIFQGNIKQVIIGRESATDTFIDIIAGDGDRAYNFSVVNTTIAPGATPSNQVQAALTSMTPNGVTQGYVGPLPQNQLPRGKVMYGNAKDYLRDVTSSTDSAWSIQNGKLQIIPLRGYLPGTAVELTSKTGMIGTPQQTNEGVNVKCLMNPLIKIGGRVFINNASIADYKINLSVPNSAANIPAPLTADGVYYVLVAEHTGDNRGIDWYTSLICLNISVTSNPINSVQTNYGE